MTNLKNKTLEMQGLTMQRLSLTALDTLNKNIRNLSQKQSW